MHWILILTLANAGTMYGGKAIHSIPDFEAKASCQVAGEAWFDKLDRSDQKMASWVCVNPAEAR